MPGSKTQHCAPSWRPHYYEPSVPNRTVKNQVESQLVYVEANAPVYIPDIDGDEENSQVGPCESKDKWFSAIVLLRGCSWARII